MVPASIGGSVYAQPTLGNGPDPHLAHEIAALSRNPQLVLDERAGVAWRCVETPRLLQDPSPVRIIGERLRMSDPHRDELFRKHLGESKDSPRRWFERSPDGGRWALITTWKTRAEPGTYVASCGCRCRRYQSSSAV